MHVHYHCSAGNCILLTHPRYSSLPGPCLLLNRICPTLQAPARLIAMNAGVEGDVIVEKVRGREFAIGYNAMYDRIENLLEAGVIDPAKVSHPSSSNIMDAVYHMTIDTILDAC